ncbi:hypothetical protein NQ318_006387 [Aromia moschata]|uniref:RNase H type-1 domain-containing protein n=1 Tax=Aromia moschata TaxID=1265417 RepID=A0AAV8YIG4_9CUCU|nr:hypothetical protein NQ318_006387 [Aromia moschata]
MPFGKLLQKHSYTDGTDVQNGTKHWSGCNKQRHRVRNQHQPGELGNLVFQAEIAAISACAQELTRRSYTNKRIHIISDSQAALKALGAVEIHSQVVKDCMDSLTKLAEHNRITLKWMRGHQDHEGNERTDFLVKKGAEVPLKARTHLRSGLPDSQEGHKGPIKRKTYIALDESPRTIKLGRNQLRWIVGLFTGHCSLMRHLTTIGVKNDPDCRRCGEEEETSFHILCECPALAAIRHSNVGAIIIEPKEVTDAALETVLKFLKETGLME